MPGYGYRFGFEHVNARRPLAALPGGVFQVCTLNADQDDDQARAPRSGSAASSRTQGHWGSTAGKRKTVYLYAHKGTAA